MALSLASSPPLVALTGNDIKFVVQTTDSSQDFYALFVQLQVSDRATPSETWSDLGSEIRVPADGNNQGEFNISDRLRETYNDHIISPSASKINKLDHVRKYRIKYYERYGSSQTKYNETTSSAFYAVQGGIGHLTDKVYNSESSNWWEKLQSKKFFLTDTPSGKVTNKFISDSLREKLFYYHYGAWTHIRLYYKAYFKDKDPVISMAIEITDAEQHNIYEIEAGYSKLDISGAYAYEIWLEDDSDTAFTEKKLFIIDDNYYRRNTYFIYTNKYEVPECILFKGEYDGASNHTKDESLNLSKKEIEEFNLDEQISREADTGLIRPEWLLHLREFYNSGKKYVLYNSYLVPIIFDSKKLSEPNSEDILYNHTIKYRFAYSSPYNDNILFISPLLTAPTAKKYIQPTTDATDVYNYSTARIEVNGLCYPGPGKIQLIQTSNSEVKMTVAAKDCIFIRDEDNDVTEVRFVIYTDALLEEHKIDIDYNAFVNKDELYFKNDLPVYWTFTFGESALQADFTTNVDTSEINNPTLTISRSIDSTDARTHKVIVKLYSVGDMLTLTYEMDDWENIVINNEVVNLYNYYSVDIELYDYINGILQDTKNDSIEFLFFYSKLINTEANFLLQIGYTSDGSLLIKKDGQYEQMEVTGGTVFDLELEQTYNEIIICGELMAYANSMQNAWKNADQWEISSSCPISVLQPNANENTLVPVIIIKNNLNITIYNHVQDASDTGTIKVDLSGCNNLEILSLEYTEIGLNGNNYQLLDLSNKPSLNLIFLPHCNFTQAMVDYLLDEVDQAGMSGGYLNLINNAIPSAAGLASKANLESKGWTVYVDS